MLTRVHAGDSEQATSREIQVSFLIAEIKSKPTAFIASISFLVHI